MTSESHSPRSRWGALQAATGLVLCCTLFRLGVPCAQAGQAPVVKRAAVPLSFEQNQGQVDPKVQFVSRGSGYALFLAPGQVVLNLEQQEVDTLRMSLVGANPRTTPEALGRQPGVVSYFIGNDPKKWRSGIPTFAKVRYSQIYPGVDLVFYGNQQQLEYDFIVAPGADPSRIAWHIEGARAAIDSAGNLTLRTPGGPASFLKPVLYQMQNGRKSLIDGAYEIAGNEIAFRLGHYDRSRELIIDPVLSYATYLGGTGTDTIGIPTGPGILQVGVSQGIAVDSVGSVYVTGYTYSLDFPTKNPYQSAPPTKPASPGQLASAYVTKFSADGTSLVYSTYLGGNGIDRGHAIAVDSSGNAYVTGQTGSPNFPTTSGAYQTICAPIPNNIGVSVATSNCNSSDYSVFVTKLNAAGTAIVYSTFLGGYGNWSYATAIAVDSAGRAYVAGNEDVVCSTGYTFQSCFPTTGNATIAGTAPTGRSPQYAFVAAFDPAGAKLLYSTLWGNSDSACTNGCGETWATGITVDTGGYFYLIGETKAAKLPTTTGVVQVSAAPLDSLQASLVAHRGFVAKFNPVTSTAGASLAWATYLGGKTATTNDYLSGIAIDASSNVYVVGYTNSADFPVTTGAYSTLCRTSGSCAAAHVTKLNSSGSTIVWSTYVGGAKADGSDAVYFTGPVQLDGNGNVYIIGQIVGAGFPMINPVEPTPTGGSADVLVAELDSAGANLLFSTHIGSKGLNTENPAGLVVDSAGNIYLAGNTGGPDLVTTTGAFQTASKDGACCQYGNGFVVKIAPTPTPTLQSGTLANGATYLAGGLVPGSWAQVKGTNLATTTRVWTGTDFTGLGSGLPTNLDGTQVTVNNLPAAVYYISPTQVSFQVPAGITGTASVQVIVNSVASNTVTAAAAANSPGIFPVTVSGTNYPAAYYYSDGKYVGDTAISSAFRRAVPGDVVQLFATGLASSPAGTLVSNTPLTGVTVTIGTVTIPADAAVLVGVGEFQINFTVPQDFATLAAGSYPISISYNGVTSPASINTSPAGPIVIPIQH